jgi:small-conductance mechanosensitive channel
LDLLSPQAWIDRAADLWAWTQENLLTWTTAVQVSTAILAFGLALLLSRRGHKWLSRHRSHASFGRAIGILLPLLFPLIWLLLDWITLVAVRYAQDPVWLLDSIAGLLMAWVVIRLVSQLVRNPVLANIFVWSAWTIAALNLLGWLDPVIIILEDARLFRLSNSGTPLDDSDDTYISLFTIVSWTISLFVLLSVAIYLSSFLEGRIRTIRTLSPSLQVLFIKSLKIVLVTLAIVIAVTSAGFDLTALAVFGGALGVGVGFGLQRIVSNLISGVILLLDKSIKPGDVIAVSGTYGWVTALGGRYVSVVTRDGVEHLIPNEILISERVENWTHTHNRTRLKVDVGVHYKSDIHQVMALCLEAAAETERVLADPDPKCLLLEFGDNSVNLQVRFWIADAHNGVQNVKSAILLGIWDKFQAAGVEIPYPQRDLHLRSGFEVFNPAS